MSWQQCWAPDRKQGQDSMLIALVGLTLEREQAMPMGIAGQTKEYMEMEKVRRKQGGGTG